MRCNTNGFGPPSGEDQGRKGPREAMQTDVKHALIDHEESFLARVAWAYYVEGLTQGQVAEKLGVTRLRVNKGLAEARKQGLVRVTFNTAYAACAQVESELMARFGLDAAYVAPSPSSAEDTQMVVGSALGHVLSELLADPKITRFGMSWGNTLNIATRSMAPLHRPDLEISSVMGGIPRGTELSSFEITKRLGDLVNGSHNYFPAPLYADSAESRETILSLAVFREAIERIRSVDAMAMATGDSSNRSLTVRDGLPADTTLADLRAAGVVGDLLGFMLDATGRPVDHPINERVIGISIEDLRAIPNVILAAGGAHKVPVLRAVLGLGLINTFVTDEATARAVLERA